MTVKREQPENITVTITVTQEEAAELAFYLKAVGYEAEHKTVTDFRSKLHNKLVAYK